MSFVNQSIEPKDRQRLEDVCLQLGERSDILFVWTVEQELDCQLICFSVGNNRSDIGEPGRYALLVKGQIVAFDAACDISVTGPGFNTFARYQVMNIRLVNGGQLDQLQIKLLIEEALKAKELSHKSARGVSVFFGIDQ